MEELSKIEKFLLAYIWHEFLGKVYFTSSEKPEIYLANTIASELIPEKELRKRRQLAELIAKAIAKLTEYWMIQVSGYEISLTSYGQSLVQGISKEEYKKLKEEIAAGKFK